VIASFAASILSSSGTARTCSGFEPAANAASGARLMPTLSVLGAGAGDRPCRSPRRIGHDVGCGRAIRSRRRDDRASRQPDLSSRRSVAHGVIVTHALPDALRDAEVVVSAIPSHGCRAVMRNAALSLARVP